MRRSLIALTATLILASATSQTSAQAPPKGFGGGKPAAGAPGASPSVLMQALDVNKNGTLSATEIRKAVRALLVLDRNRDGMLTPDELQPAKPAAAAGAGGGKPAGAGGGKGAPAGLGAGAGRGAAAGRFGGQPAGNPGFGALGGGGFSRPPGSRLPSQLNKIMGFDKNRDGRVSRSEIPKQLLPWFQRADLDRNGFVDAKELRALQAKGAGGIGR